MPNVYSELLCEVPISPAGAIAIGTPPPGRKWIVKDVTAVFKGGLAYPLLGFILEDNVGCPILVVEQPWSTTGYTYHYAGAQVIEQGDQLILDSHEPGWSIRVSGYSLVLP